MPLQLGAYLRPADWVRRIGGPVLDKELRVASRRRWSYVLRFAYLALLTGYVAVCWASAVAAPSMPVPLTPAPGGQSYVASRMAGVGQHVVAAIVWFQFLAAQVLAATMLSTAVGGEIRRRTLVTLLTTPVSDFKILLGKLAGCQLQLVLLVATSLPLLALVRVFGGVPWDFVAAGACLTVAGAIFTGSVSLYFSVSSRRAWSALLKTVVVVGPALFLLPMAFLGSITVVAGHSSLSEAMTWLVLSFTGPATGLEFATANLFKPSANTVGVWPTTCLVTLGTAMCVLALAARRLRAACFAIPVETALEAVVNRPHTAHGRAYSAAHQIIRRIEGSPIVWRETHLAGALPAELRQIAKGFALVVFVFVTLFALTFGSTEIACAFLYLAVAVTAFLAASSITREKEAGAWPSLLMTPLSNRDVVLGKMIGVLRRTWVLWLLPSAQMACFAVFGSAHVGMFVYFLLWAPGVAVLVSGTGVYFSVRFRRSASAVAWALGFVAAWLAAPSVLGLVYGLLAPPAHASPVPGMHPRMSFATMTYRVGGDYCFGGGDYSGAWMHLWPDMDLPVEFALLLGLLSLAWNVAPGILMAWRAAARVRRNVF